jgi:hypothetical protein
MADPAAGVGTCQISALLRLRIRRATGTVSALPIGGRHVLSSPSVRLQARLLRRSARPAACLDSIGLGNIAIHMTFAKHFGCRNTDPVTPVASGRSRPQTRTGEGAVPVLRRALVVGINNYDQFSTGLLPLYSAAGDAARVRPLLETHYDSEPNWIVTPLDDEDGGTVRRQQLHDAITDLFRPTRETLLQIAANNGISAEDLSDPLRQEVLFYFSGHADVGRDGVTRLFAYDDAWYSFEELMRLISRSKADSMTLILDCCMSGNIGHRGDPLNDPLAHRSGADGANPFEIDLTLLPDNVCILTASRPYQEAKEDRLSGGVFSEMVIGALAGAAADIMGNVTSLSLYSHASEALGIHGQRPMFKANLDQPVLLRTSTPKVPAWSLKELPNIFVTEIADGRVRVRPVPLSEEHEGIPGKDKPRMSDDWADFQGSPKQTELDHLKKWLKANLVVASSGKDFYKLTNESKEGDDRDVILTPQGHYYRDLAVAGLFHDAIRPEAL